MSCSDCNECGYNIDNGGTCTEYEYDCPYAVFFKLPESAIKDIIKILNGMDSDFCKIRDIFTSNNTDFSDYFPGFAHSFSDILELFNPTTYEKWKKMIKDTEELKKPSSASDYCTNGSANYCVSCPHRYCQYENEKYLKLIENTAKQIEEGLYWIYIDFEYKDVIALTAFTRYRDWLYAKGFEGREPSYKEWIRYDNNGEPVKDCGFHYGTFYFHPIHDKE
jgi:hypothetical protein